MTPYEAWYGTKPHINNLRVWGCYIYVHIPDPKKLDHRVTRGHFLGFTKSRLIVRWYDPSTNVVKHANAVRFDELNTRLTSSDQLSPGALILSGSDPSIPELTSIIDLTDHPHLGTTPFMISLQLPPLGTGLGCYISTDTYHNLPYISSFTSGTPLSQQLLQHGQYNSSFWVLSINSKEFLTAPAVIDYLKSIQLDNTTLYVPAIFARCVASHRTSLSGNRAIFNQIRLITEPRATLDSASPSIVVCVGLKVVSSPIQPDTPAPFGATYSSPFASDWHDALFQNYNKMLATGTFSAPILRFSVPPQKTVLRPRVVCRAASECLLISILDISNAFQNSIIFDAAERVYLSLPPLYLEWFRPTVARL